MEKDKTKHKFPLVYRSPYSVEITSVERIVATVGNTSKIK